MGTTSRTRSRARWCRMASPTRDTGPPEQYGRPHDCWAQLLPQTYLSFFYAAITCFLYLGVQGKCDSPWQRAIRRSFADDVRHRTYLFGKAQLNTIVPVFDDFLAGPIAGYQPRGIVVIGSAA